MVGVFLKARGMCLYKWIWGCGGLLSTKQSDCQWCGQRAISRKTQRENRSIPIRTVAKLYKYLPILLLDRIRCAVLGKMIESPKVHDPHKWTLTGNDPCDHPTLRSIQPVFASTSHRGSPNTRNREIAQGKSMEGSTKDRNLLSSCSMSKLPIRARCHVCHAWSIK